MESVFWWFLIVQDGIVNNYESQLREFKGYLHKVLNVLLYAIINYQFKTSELKNLEKLVKQTVQALEPYKNRLEIYIFVQSVKLYIPCRWFLKSPWKMVGIFCMNPVKEFI